MQIGDRYQWESASGEQYEVEIASPFIGGYMSLVDPNQPAGPRIMVRVMTGPHRRTFALVDPAKLSKIED